MNITNESMLIIFESIEVYQGLDLYNSEKFDKQVLSNYLLELDKEGLINIHLKFVAQDGILFFTNLSMTANGEEKYKTLLNEVLSSV